MAPTSGGSPRPTPVAHPVRTATATLAACLVASGCAPSPDPAEAPGPPEPASSSGPRLPPVPEVRGPLAIDVAYPKPDEPVGAVDSTFIFGSVGNGAATLVVNGAPVEVHPNGAWLAFLPVPADGRYELVARLDGRTERAVHVVQVTPRPAVDAAPGRPGIVPGSLSPSGPMTVVRGEAVEVSIRATRGALATLVLPGGRRIALTERPAGLRHVGFGLDRSDPLPDVSEYEGTWVVERPLLPAPGADPGPAGAPTLAPSAPGAPEAQEASGEGAFVELAWPGESTRVPLEAWIALLEPGETRVVVVDTPRPDSTAVGRMALGAEQAWEYFWWNRTRLAVDGERWGFYRVRLEPELHAWVSRADVRLEPPGAEPPGVEVGPTVAAASGGDWVDLRFGASAPLPYRIDPSPRGLAVTFHGATGRPAYVSYGASDPFVERLHWEQATDHRFRFHVELGERLWGFRTRWDGNGDLVVRVRRPPAIDLDAPLRGLVVAVDAGHPPGGAIGPTGLTEDEANLSVTRQLVPMLEARGARVLEIRPDTGAVGLFDRVMAVHDREPDLSVSVHFNAYPDGVNPFERNGTIVFYYWPQSVELARSLQESIVGELGLPDMGIRFQNLALTRIWSTPAVLTETLFLMIPGYEAAVRQEAVQRRIAEAHLRGIERFLAEVGREQAAAGGR